MYQPSAFRQDDPEAMAQLMAEYPLATVMHHDPQTGLGADLLPLIWQPDATGLAGRLLGHVARANPLWQRAEEHPVLVQFLGPQAYVHPGWYPAKARHAQVVPTWNYTVVQAQGVLRSTQDRAELRERVTLLTDRQEQPRPLPWAVTDAPADYIDRMLAAIVGIEIRVHTLTGKWKLGQNRDAADQAGLQAGLQQTSNAAARELASWMPSPPPITG